MNVVYYADHFFSFSFLILSFGKQGRSGNGIWHLTLFSHFFFSWNIFEYQKVCIHFQLSPTTFLLNLVSKQITMQTCSIQNAVLKIYFIQFFYNKYFFDCHSEPLWFFLIKIWLFLQYLGLLQLNYYYEELSWLFSGCQINNAKKIAAVLSLPNVFELLLQLTSSPTQWTVD